MKFEKYLNIVDQKSDVICGASDAIWDLAELSYGEYKSSALLADILEKEGFTIEWNLADIPTAFKATFGHGKPAMGVLAEYDGLSGMSQEGHCTERKPIEGKDTSHGCGHNLFGAGSMGAVLAIKSYIEETGKGSITLFGCPAEEGGAGKCYMARAGVFNGIDAIVSWHPERMYMVRTRGALANYGILFSFEGIASNCFHQGRSALDAVELMNVGGNYLREHVDPDCRFHYATVDTGGTSPNMVQSHAAVKYTLRAPTKKELDALMARMCDVARGAALMTGTKVSWKIQAAYSELITIPTLQATANEAMHDIPVPIPTEEDVAYGVAIQKTYPHYDRLKDNPPYATEVRDPAPRVYHSGSTDTADVSWNVPTVQMHIATWVVGTPGHSWQSVSQARSPHTKRTMLYAAKAVAGTVMRLMENPDLIAKAKEEHAEKTAGGYVCPLPDDAQPAILPRPEG